MEDIVIATSNAGKLEEFKELLRRVPVRVRYLAEYPRVVPPEETGRTFAANAKQKAAYYAKALGAYCLADDSGLEVRALDGAPGVRSARFAGEGATDEENNNMLLLKMKFKLRRSCRFRCALAVAAPDGRIVAESDGSCDGMLLHEPIGKLGFGYDPLFWSTELHKSLGEASADEKNRISHRARAVRNLLALWKKTGMLLVEDDPMLPPLEEPYDPRTDVGTLSDVRHVQHAPLMKRPEPRTDRRRNVDVFASEDMAGETFVTPVEAPRAMGTSLSDSQAAANLLAATGQIDEDNELVETEKARDVVAASELTRVKGVAMDVATDADAPLDGDVESANAEVANDLGDADAAETDALNVDAEGAETGNGCEAAKDAGAEAMHADGVTEVNTVLGAAENVSVTQTKAAQVAAPGDFFAAVEAVAKAEAERMAATQRTQESGRGGRSRRGRRSNVRSEQDGEDARELRRSRDGERSEARREARSERSGRNEGRKDRTRDNRAGGEVRTGGEEPRNHLLEREHGERNTNSRDRSEDSRNRRSRRNEDRKERAPRSTREAGERRNDTRSDRMDVRSSEPGGGRRSDRTVGGYHNSWGQEAAATGDNAGRERPRRDRGGRNRGSRYPRQGEGNPAGGAPVTPPKG